MKHLLVLAIALSLAACSSIVKVEGDQVVNNRLVVKVPDAWNKVALAGPALPYEVWTQEGLSLDQLRMWAAVRAGQPLISPPAPQPGAQAAPRVPTFTAGMRPDELVRLFETLFAADGSMVSMTRVEPVVFAGEKGVRFEFSLVRKGDDVQLNGVGWASVRNDELFAATFIAPRLHFYPRLLPRAESVVRTAQIRG